MNIVYGGSFNPPTIAHYEAIKLLLKKYNPENLIVVPVSINYTHKDNLISNYDRLEMLRLMTKSLNVIISDIEINNTKYFGTYNLLNKLSAKYEDLYFVMGADNLINLDTWIDSQLLLEKYKFIVFSRNDIDCLKIINEKYKAYMNKFHLIDFDFKVSSTEFRLNPKEHKNYLTNDVYYYILEHKLYNYN